MQQRFVIAMALIGSPDLVVLDEPTSALDPVVAARSMDLLDESLSGGRTAMMLITHDLALTAQRVDRLIVLDAGRVVEDAPTDRLLAAPETHCAQKLCAHKSWMAMPC